MVAQLHRLVDMVSAARLRLVCLTALLVVVSLACQISVDLGEGAPLADAATETPISVETFPARVGQDLASHQDALVTLYQTAGRGVVSLLIDSPIGAKQGSGFVIDSQGHIVTNDHVVDRARGIEVVFQNGMRAPAEVIGRDAESDLAVIKVDISEDLLFPLSFADSDEILVGQLVIAIGNPFGLNGSMSTGIVSSLARTLPSLNAAPEGGEDIFAAGDLVQTDAAINPGNSGGPLLNLNGEVVGVNRAIRTFYINSENNSMSSGIGFAISSNIATKVIPSLIEKGFYEYPYLGIASITELTLNTAEASGLTSTSGAFVRNLVEGGPAEAAGLMAGDLIVSVNGVEVVSSGDLASYLLKNSSPGDSIQLVYLRGEDSFETELILGVRPASECEC
jgi:S1-C subfamily serine protease